MLAHFRVLLINLSTIRISDGQIQPGSARFQKIGTKTYNNFCIFKMIGRNSFFPKLCFIGQQHTAIGNSIILHMLLQDILQEIQ